MAPIVVQTAQNSGNATSVTVTLTHGTQTGNCLVAAISSAAATTNGTISGITLGGKADHWGSVFSVGTGTSDSILSFWADPNCSGGLTSVVVSTTGSSGTESISVTVWEVSGLPSTVAALLDASAGTASGTSSTSFTSGTTSATVLKSEIAFGIVGCPSAGTLTGPANPWVNSAQQNETEGNTVAGYNILTTTQTIAYAGSISPTEGYAAAVCTLKTSGPKVSQRVQVIRARIPFRASGYRVGIAGGIYGSGGTGDTSFGTGRILWSPGAPVNNPPPPPPGLVVGNPITPGVFEPGAAEPGKPLQLLVGPLFTQKVQALRARLPRQPVLRGHVVSNRGTTISAPSPVGPVFHPATSPCRARIPQRAAGSITGRGVSGTICGAINGGGFGNANGSSGAPVSNPTPGPLFKQRTTPVRYILPPPHPRAGRIGSSFGAVVSNPTHGPPVYPLESPVKARLPLQPLLRGRVSSNSGAPVHDPTSGPVFHPKVQPIRAAIPQVFSKGRVSSNAGAPVHNPTSGPVFYQKTSPVRVHPTLPPRGRVASNKGAPVFFTVTGPPFYPADSPIRARIPKNAPRGRNSSNIGAPVSNPTPGPVFRQAVHPIRAVIPQVFSKGRTEGNKGTIQPGPPAPPLHAPVRARTTSPFSKGRTYSNPGAPVHNPTPGPVFHPAVKPIRATIPQVFSKGHIGSNPGGPVANPPGIPAPLYPLHGPARSKVPLHPRAGRIASNHGGPVNNPPPPPPPNPPGAYTFFMGSM